MRKWHFSLSETVSTDWQYILKRKANAHNTLKQKYRHYFFNKFNTLACTTLLNLDLQLSFTDHKFRTKVFCYKKNKKTRSVSIVVLLMSSLQLQIFVLYTIRLTRLILIHLGKNEALGSHPQVKMKIKSLHALKTFTKKYSRQKK